MMNRLTNNVKDCIAKIRFWHAKKFLKLGVHYDFMFDANNTNAISVKYLKNYSNTIVEFSNFRMSSNTDLSYDFNVISNPTSHDVNSKQFQSFTTHVVRSILIDAIRNATREKNENRNADSVKSDSKRDVHEEDAALFEEGVSDRKSRKKSIRGNKAVHSEVQQPAADSSVGDQS